MAGRAEFFEARAARWEETCYPPEVRARLEAFLPHFGIGLGEWVLDVGTGPGILVPYVHRLVGPEGRIVALDLVRAMTVEASKKCAAPWGMVLQADVHAIPCRSGVFDRVLCFAAFPHFKEQPRALAEMARVLKPEGELIIAHLMSREELAQHHATHEDVRRDVLPDARTMTFLMRAAGFHVRTLVDEPGRYLLKAVRSCTVAP
ncbi:class I SAM-dependent methyltransferase [Desulfosoma caldarium]|uniref:Methyltransferase family protein n=1 Tax=Desulfosoma caldarium TaxID=610254 RepID=A0A3N1UU05_9BACT|nr:class I SAM-dependent methyltransferase [Desulfosoma caldarium]ROQ93198.1 methyltransferase family protein [Desulfosoma caldarium]